MLTEPPSGTCEQRVRHGPIIFTFEGAEEPDPVVMEAIVCVIDDGLDAADWMAVTLGEEEGSLGVEEERMAPFVEQVSVLPPERGHEMRTVPVKTIWNVEEPAKSPPGVGRNDLERWH